MTSLSAYDLPFEGIEKTLIAWTAEALELRHGEAEDPKGKVSLPPYELGLHAVIDSVHRVRSRLDRVEELQSKARQAKGRVARTRANADFESKRAFDEALQRNANARTQSFVTSAERNADATLDSFNQKRLAHQSAQLESVATEVLDVITQCYWGLEKLRDDHLQMMKLQQGITAVEALS